jgi:hypothetical protein
MTGFEPGADCLLLVPQVAYPTFSSPLGHQRADTLHVHPFTAQSGIALRQGQLAFGALVLRSSPP